MPKRLIRNKYQKFQSIFKLLFLNKYFCRFLKKIDCKNLRINLVTEYKKEDPLTVVFNYDCVTLWIKHHKMKDTRNNCFGSKIHSTTIVKTEKREWRNVTTATIAVICRHSCLPVFPDEGSCYVFFDPKQLLRVFYILCC